VVAVTWGLTVLDGWAELGWQGIPVAWPVCLPPDALVLAFAEAVVLVAFAEAVVLVAFAEAVVLALPVAVEVALAVPVAVAVAVPVAVALSPGLLLVLPAGGLLAESAGDALGGGTDLADLADSAALDDGEPGGHTVPGTLL
jgi:hypothetical protein